MLEKVMMEFMKEKLVLAICLIVAIEIFECTVSQKGKSVFF